MPSIIQAKLAIGEPNDPYEQEADRVAEQVVNTIHQPQGQPSVQRSDLPDDDELQMKPTSIQRSDLPDDDELQMKPASIQREADGGGEASADLESGIARARGGGQALEPGLQRQMGQAMGADFSGVRVHTDGQADQLNRSIQAKAFTTGQDVFFRQGAYEPGSRSGQELIAHELTHVVQQSQGGDETVRRSLLRQGKLNVVGENHEESGKQREKEKAYVKSKLGSGAGYWEEPEFTTSEVKGSTGAKSSKSAKQGDDPTLRLYQLVTFIGRNAQWAQAASSLEQAIARFSATDSSPEAREAAIKDAKKALRRLRGWQEERGKMYQLLEIQFSQTKESGLNNDQASWIQAGIGRYEAQRQSLIIPLSVDWEQGTGSSKKTAEGGRTRSKQITSYSSSSSSSSSSTASLASVARIPIAVQHLDSEDRALYSMIMGTSLPAKGTGKASEWSESVYEICYDRSVKMALAAANSSNTVGVWKVGQLHLDDIRLIGGAVEMLGADKKYMKMKVKSGEESILPIQLFNLMSQGVPFGVITQAQFQEELKQSGGVQTASLPPEKDQTQEDSAE